MRKKASHADYLKDWQHLLATVQTVPELSGSRHKAKLEALVSQMGQVTTRRAQSQAAKQVASLELKQVVADGKDTARDLMAEMKGHFGSRSEELVQFGVLPLRPSSKARRTAPETPPTGGGPEVPTPAAGVQPANRG
jgi:hypothetical protein